MGRPSKYNEETVERICADIREGYNRHDAAARAGVDDSTVFDWMNRYPDFSDKVKEADREHLRIKGRRLVTSIFKRAEGYDVEEADTIMIPDKSGKPQVKMQKLKKKHIPADVKAAIFLLTNLYPDEWQDKQKNELTGSLSNKVTIEYVDSGVDLAHSEDEIAE